MTIDDCIRDVVGYEGKYKINIVGEIFNACDVAVFFAGCNLLPPSSQLPFQ